MKPFQCNCKLVRSCILSYLVFRLIKRVFPHTPLSCLYVHVTLKVMYVSDIMLRVSAFQRCLPENIVDLRLFFIFFNVFFFNMSKRRRSLNQVIKSSILLLVSRAHACTIHIRLRLKHLSLSLSLSMSVSTTSALSVNFSTAIPALGLGKFRLTYAFLPIGFRDP